MHMGSGFCLCAGADFLSARGAVKTAPYDAKDKRVQQQGCGPGMPGPYRVALFVRRGGFHIRPQACAAAEGLRIAL